MMAWVAEVFIGGLVGLLLGLTGAGGSAIAMPLLHLIMPLQQAVGLSLATVAGSAAYGVYLRRGQHLVQPLPAALLAVSGAVTAPLGQMLNARVQPWVVLSLFTLMSCLLVVNFWRAGRAGRRAPEQGLCQAIGGTHFCPGLLALGGAVVGLLSGFLGVGGGFLIVPLLIMLTAMRMPNASATSLLVIVFVSTAGFLGFVSRDSQLDGLSLVPVLVGALLGMFAGSRLHHRFSEAHLKRLFAVALAGTTGLSAWALFHSL